ncbi:MAG TPA: hypothetical protein VN811_05870 [Thermoanaerobaculia bacterium]|nr:hypothetical protein [Thermoanaerobaculia bacterium]
MSKRRLAAFSVIALFAAASASAATVPPAATFSDADDELIALGRGIPGFGGMFVDAEGALHVWMLDPDAGGAVDKALSGLARPTDPAGESVRLHRGDFTFERLVAWKRTLTPVLSLPGVLSLDADEARNRVTIGIVHGMAPADRERLEAALAAGDVPSRAVAFREGEPFKALPLAVNANAIDAKASPSIATLTDKIRPVPGGMQVAFGCSNIACFVCTDGFTAIRGKTLGFVTNSHCTGERGTVDSTRYSQSTPSGGIVGTEIVDPPHFACGVGRRCRFSDAAFVKFDKKSFGSLARIAKPFNNGTDFALTLMTPATSRFVVSGAGPSPRTGDILHKVGRTTGWTYGPVTGTCVEVSVSGTDITYSCQTLVTAGADGGDSGSPVFSWGGGKTAQLQGLLWGGGDFDGQRVYAFSSLGQIQQELGALKIK